MLFRSKSDEEYYIDLLDAIVGFRVDKIANFEVGETKPTDKRYKVIIWNGRAQPWHIGHDNMVQIGKQTLEEVGADAVYIMIVKGTQTELPLPYGPGLTVPMVTCPKVCSVTKSPNRYSKYFFNN